MSTEPKSGSRYHLDVVKSEIVSCRTNGIPFLFPSPFIAISLDGQQIYVTTTKAWTLTPVWDEFVELKSDDPTSIISINLCRISLAFGALVTRYIGSTQLSIEKLEELGVFNQDISLDLFENDVKTAVVIIRFKMDEPLVAEPKILAKVPPELRPEFVTPQHPSSPEKKLQIVGYQSRDISKDQVDGIVRRILARSSGEDSDSAIEESEDVA